MKDILLLNKEVGETPLECLERFRSEHAEYQGVKMTYAGRLDPMAEGLLLVLAGDKVHEKEKFLKLPKSYECVAIIGVGSDTYDVLGMPTPPPASRGTPSDRGGDERVPPLSEGVAVGRGCIEILNSFIGTFKQQYPPYSSKTVNGKQLHTLAREGNLESVEMPTQLVTVENILIKGIGSIAIGDLVGDIRNRIKKVKGDFRQEEILRAWQELAQKDPETRLTFVIFDVDVSGGTYIRGLVHEMGKKLGIPSLIWKLRRTKLGDWTA